MGREIRWWVGFALESPFSVVTASRDEIPRRHRLYGLELFT